MWVHALVIVFISIVALISSTARIRPVKYKDANGKITMADGTTKVHAHDVQAAIEAVVPEMSELGVGNEIMGKHENSTYKDVAHRRDASLLEQSAQTMQAVAAEERSVLKMATDTETVEAAAAQAKGYHIKSLFLTKGLRKKLAKGSTVRVVREMKGHSRSRWRSSRDDENTVPFFLFKGDLGTVNSKSKHTREVSVIFDSDVEREVWVDSDNLVDELPLKESDDEEAIKAVLELFPRSYPSPALAPFKCPITKKIFRNPMVASDGRTYEWSAIQQASGSSEALIPNRGIRALIKDMVAKITPPEPITPKRPWWLSLWNWKKDEAAEKEEVLLNLLAKSPPALGSANMGSLICPISQELFRDPVLAHDGFTYEREFIEDWLKKDKPNSPTTNKPILTKDVFPNRAMKMLLSVLLETVDSMPETSAGEVSPVD